MQRTRALLGRPVGAALAARGPPRSVRHAGERTGHGAPWGRARGAEACERFHERSGGLRHAPVMAPARLPRWV